MMDFPLTLAAIFRHAEQVHPRRDIVTRRPDGSLHRYTYADFAARARRLAGALHRLGIRPGARVATLGWNHFQHLEAYFAIPLAGGVLHTLNLRLHPDEIAFIVNDADDGLVLVDESLLPLWEQVAPRTRVARAIVVGATCGVPPGYLEYEALLEDADPLEPSPIRTSARPRRCATRPARQDSPRACSIRTGPWCCTRSPSPCRPAWAWTSRTPCCPSSRCFTPTPGACRTLP